MKSNISNSPRLKELRRKRNISLRNRVIFLFFCFVMLIIGLGFLSRWHKINILDVQVVGNKVVDGRQITQIANNVLVGHYLWLFPKTNFLLYPKAKINQKLTERFMELENISLKIKDPNKLEINVSERTPSYTWCGNTIPEHKDEMKCYFTDEKGYIFGTAPYFSGEVYFKLFGQVEHLKDSPLGQYFLKGQLPSFELFRNNLTKMGLKPSSLYLKSDNEANLFLSSSVLPPNSPKIIFKIDENLYNITENLQTVLSTEPFQSDFKKKYNLLDYIDLRFDNKVYYKFK